MYLVEIVVFLVLYRKNFILPAVSQYYLMKGAALSTLLLVTYF